MPYINKGLGLKGKAMDIKDLYNGIFISKPMSFADIPAGKALIVVVDNGGFEAAGFAYDEREFESYVNSPNDDRRKEFVLIDWQLACELTGFKQEEE